MKLNKIKLNNIRSHVDQELIFPEGTTLLSGDVGSGKSSILLAVDFALFGIRPGELSGSALLRNGADSGSVELDFNIEEKNIIIKRKLKRGKSVTQDAGHIIIDGALRQATAVELKQGILSLLNYPKDLLTKSKSLIYRYTVYTPQEEMKQILSGDKDFRLDALRKVFGIDKYKRIRENVEIVVSKIKEKRKILAGMIADLEIKRSELQEREDKVRKLEKDVVVLSADLNSLASGINEHKVDLDRIEASIKEFDTIKKNLEINEVKLKDLADKKNKLHDESESLSLQIKDLEQEITKDKIDFDKDKKVETELRIREVNDEVNRFNLKVNESATKKNSSEETKNKINALKLCPTCKQEVNDTHKHLIIENENKNITFLDKEIADLIAKRSISQLETEKLKKEYDLMLIAETKSELNKIRYNNLSEKMERKNKFIKEQEEIKKLIGEFNVKNAELFVKIEAFGDLRKKFDEIKLRLEETNEKLRIVEIEKGGVEKELQTIGEIILKLKREVEQKEKIKLKIVYLGDIQHWLTENFSKMVEIMERKVMLAVHSGFNSLFQKWFSMLIDNELIKVRLDEEFSPIIEQNGYETDFNHLSGGERTAASLAYRLALNQVINTVMSVIKTKDLLILDEPTEGFSSEQLDRMKAVLDELNTKQIIIVSHESKIESFVDNVIRLNKREHVSEILI